MTALEFYLVLQQVTTLVKSQAAGSGSATSSQSVTIPVQMQNVQGIKHLASEPGLLRSVRKWQILIQQLDS